MSRRIKRGMHLPSIGRVGLTLLACVALVAPTAANGAQAPVGPAAPVANAAVTLPASTQFDLTGFLEVATLGGPGTGAGVGAHQGGSLTVNGHDVIVPSETVVILPANALTWQELFAQAPAPYTDVATGMAQADVPTPLTTYEVHVVGNRVGNTYIAGLIDISQQGLNAGAGYVNFMDYAKGEMRVGGTIGSATTGARVQLNDPTGRFGRVVSPDQRFTVDADNPTIASASGFPMCFPRTDPTVTDDAACPQGNRPSDGAGFASILQMNDPALPGSPYPDADKQAPIEVGDYVSYAGTLVTDKAARPTTGPWPVNGTADTYVSAHTITDTTAIYTWPGTNPAYVSIEVSLVGTGGLTVIGATEAVIRTRVEGMTTDPSRNIHLYAVDLNPTTGASTDRDWGTIGVDPGAPTGAVKGRWRFRPPCLVAGSVPTKPQTQCVMNADGTFLAPPREVRAVIEGAWVPGQIKTHANGIIAGQYHAPIGEYIFPENIPGTPIPENNFNTIKFLAKGGQTSAAGTLVGQLDPWPSNVVPVAACVTPVASVGGPYTVSSAGTVTFAGSATGDTPLTFAWAPPSAGTLSDPAIARPVYTAPSVVVQTTVNLSLTVTNGCSVGTSNSNTTVTINPPAHPTVSYVPDFPVLNAVSGAATNVTATGLDAGGLPVSVLWTQENIGAPGVPTLLPAPGLTCGPTAGTVTCLLKVLYTLPVGAGPVTIQVAAEATNSLGLKSGKDFTSVVINPPADIVNLTTALWSAAKQRLDLTATSSTISPNVVLTLQPYKTTTGTIYDPTALGAVFTNSGGGLYVLTLVGGPEPAIPPARPLQVKSSLGGISVFTALTKIK